MLPGGFGSGVIEALADRDALGEARVLRFGLPDRFVTHGKPALLREEVGLTPEAVAGRVAEALLAPRGIAERIAELCQRWGPARLWPAGRELALPEARTRRTKESDPPRGAAGRSREECCVM